LSLARNRKELLLELYFPNDVDKREDLKSQMLAQVSKPKGFECSASLRSTKSTSASLEGSVDIHSAISSIAKVKRNIYA
jgi:hypothetical protein